MAIMIHAVFDPASDSAGVIRDLAQRTEDHPSFAVQIHHDRVLDGDSLPESGTEVGRNTAMATGIGSAAGLALGVMAGAGLDFPGFNVATGAGMGLLFGGLVGVLSGLMAGARQPKARLRELAAGMDPSAALVTVEVDDRGQADDVERSLKRAGGQSVGRC